MYLTREIYALLYPEEETFYLEVSRRSLCPALLAQKKYELVISALPRQILTGSQVAEYCGAICPDEWTEKKLDLKTQDQKDTIRTFLEGLQPFGDAQAVSGYLTNCGLQQGDILVDIGSGGTTQMLLEALCKIRLYGLQLSEDERLRMRFSEDRTKAFLSLSGREAGLYWAGQPILERMISQEIGPSTGYIRTQEGFTVIHPSQKKEPVILQMQQGALAFAREWQQSVLKEWDLPPSLAIEPFLQLVAAPGKDQLSLLGDLSVEDGGVYPLAAPKHLVWYLLHPRELKKDFSLARWKIGFLARLLRLPLPYDRLYLALKK